MNRWITNIGIAIAAGLLLAATCFAQTTTTATTSTQPAADDQVDIVIDTEPATQPAATQPAMPPLVYLVAAPEGQPNDRPMSESIEQMRVVNDQALSDVRAEVADLKKSVADLHDCNHALVQRIDDLMDALDEGPVSGRSASQSTSTPPRPRRSSRPSCRKSPRGARCASSKIGHTKN